MLRAFSHTRRKAHLLFSVSQSRILQTEKHNSGPVFGAVSGGGWAREARRASYLVTLLLAKTTPAVLLLLGDLGVFEMFSGTIEKVMYVSV